MIKSKYVLWSISILLIGVPSCHKQTMEEKLKSLSDDIQTDSTNAALYHERGMLLFIRGNLKEAESDQSRAIKIDSSSSEAFKSRGLIYFRKTNYKNAILDFTKAIELGDTRAFGLRSLAYFYSRLYILALRDCERMQANGITEAELMSECHILLGEYSKAINDLKKGMKAPDKDFLYSSRTSMLLAAEGKYDEAISTLTDALSNDTSQYGAFLFENRGILYYKIGEYDKSFSDFEKAIKRQDNKSGLPFFYSGMILAGENRVSDALKMLDSAVNRNFGFYDLILYNKQISPQNRLLLELKCDSLLKIKNPKFSSERLHSILLRDTAGGDDSELLSERMAAIFVEKDLQKEYRKCYQLLLESMQHSE
jgi:tetratricopeptide (TPR) repeat protein